MEAEKNKKGSTSAGKTKKRAPAANLGSLPKKPRVEQHKEADSQIASQRAAMNTSTGKQPVNQSRPPTTGLPKRQAQLTIGGTIVNPTAARQEVGSPNDRDRAPDAQAGTLKRVGKKPRSFFDSSSATHQFLRYQYVGDNITKDSGACSELMYSIRGNDLPYPRIADLSFPNLYGAIARNDMKTKAMTNELISRYERSAAIDLEKIKKLEAELADEKKKSTLLKNEISQLRNELAVEKAKPSSGGEVDRLGDEPAAERANPALEAEVARLKEELAAEKEAHAKTTALYDDRGDLIVRVDEKFNEFRVRFNRLRNRLIYLTETKPITDVLCQVRGTLEVLKLFEERGVQVPQDLVDKIGRTMSRYEEKLHQIEVVEIDDSDLDPLNYSSDSE